MLWVTAVTAFFTMVGKFLEGFVMILPDLLALIRSWKKLIDDRIQREKDAEQAQVTAILQAEAREQALATANLLAFKQIIEDAWRIRYEQILGYLVAGSPESVIVLTDEIDNPVVNQILFYSKAGNEIKAMRIVEQMRKPK